jgi:purine-nucleoside phosphorylase
MTRTKRRNGGTADETAALRERLAGLRPQVGIVVGSGLGGLADALAAKTAVPFRDLPGLAEPGVAGHRGEFLAGTLEGVPVILQCGRLHLYEGHAPEGVTRPIRLMAGAGIDTLIVTNAAGGIRPHLTPPALMLITDHLNLTGRSPLAGPVLPGEQRFPDMSQAYDPELRAAARRVAGATGITLHEGVYAGLLGPSFETPAEIRMLERLGADAVGMSTVLEVIVARARGIRVLGISTITNLAAGIATAPLSHEEVLAAGRAVTEDLAALIRGVLRGGL